VNWKYPVALLILLACGLTALGADIDDAIQKDSLEKIRTLLKHNPGLISSKDIEGQTPLHIAAAIGRTSVVKLLLTKKVQVNAKDGEGRTPLHLAAEKGNTAAAEVLLLGKANIDAKDNDGDTPLHLAAANGRKAMAQMLMLCQPDIKSTNNAGETPADAAEKHKHKDMVEMLRGHYEASGTGFFVTEDGYLVSNYHVVNGAVKIRIITGGGTNEAKVVCVDTNDDLAVLKVDGHFTPLPVASSANVQLGSTVATVGFPDPELQGFSPKLSKGEIASLAGMRDDARYFQISVPLQPGNSGGAMVDEHGNVVGIVSAKLSSFAAMMVTGETPEDVNYAVKSSLLLNLLKTVPDISNKLKLPNMVAETFPAVVKSAQQAAVLIHVDVELVQPK
jgi:S1-C subfamily serine protease